MNRFQRELVSRATAGVLGAALLFGAWKVASTAAAMAAEAEQRAQETYAVRDRRASGAGHVYAVAILLSVVEVPCVVYAVTPPRVLEWLLRPSPPETGDRSVPDVDRGAWWWPF
ncbi:MAG TPA: hypothetical protein VF796_28965 [Humisphaera sp.]